jgi:quinol-cytochrome oxidoreductase complex cytochrome b subunit
MACGFWSAVIPVVMDPRNGFAVSEDGIVNANLYFFSWAGLIMSFIVFIGHINERNQQTKRIAFIETPSIWACLCVTSCITMVSASRLFNVDECTAKDSGGPDSEPGHCSRLTWGVSLGLTSTLLSVAWPACHAFASEKMTELVEPVLSTLVLILWVFGISYITFGGSKAPGASVGNLYFATWGSFVISAYLTMNAWKSLFPTTNDSMESPPHRTPTITTTQQQVQEQENA